MGVSSTVLRFNLCLEKRAMKTRRKFNDSEMSLFSSVYAFPSTATATPDTARGRGTVESSVYGSVVRKCVYSVRTAMGFSGLFAHRVFRMANWQFAGSVKSATISIQADAADLKGYGFMDVVITKGDDTTFSFGLNAKDARNLAQMLNAAANSTGATWRKSSIT